MPSPVLFRRSALSLAAALTLSLLTACGGSSEPATALNSPSDRLEAVASDLARAGQARRRALAADAATAALRALTVYDPEAAAEQLMNFAETGYPEHFPARAATASHPPFAYRHQPATGVYLGVVLDDGAYTRSGVYVMGGAFGVQPMYVGQLTDFITPDVPGFRAVPQIDRVPVMQGGSTTLQVSLERLRGWNGVVELTLAGLPPGVRAASVQVPAHARTAEIVLTADLAAAHTLPTAVSLRASGVFGTRVVSAQQELLVTVRGAPGVLDTSYGGGVQITEVNRSEDYAHAVALQADGKVVTVGTTAINTGTVVGLTRHLRDGGLDPSFGTGGKVTTQVGARGDSARAVAIQSDGRIVVAGWTDQTGTDANILVLRYLANGTLDPSFGDAGRVVLPLSTGTDRAFAVAVQTDGRIVVGGTTLLNTSTTGQDFALVRLLSNGTLDTGFGDGGRVITAIQSHSGGDIVYALALPVVNGEQRILAVGGEGDFLAARYTANGQLDTSFGSGGKVVGLFRSNIGAARAVTLLPGGRMLLAGGSQNDFAAAQLTESGALDTAFGQDGKVTVPVSTANWDNATAVARQADGRLLLGGWTFAGNSSAANFTAVRLMANGALDGSFGTGGIAIHPVAAGTRNDSARGLVLQSDERVPAARAILGGEASDGDNDFALIRLWL